MDTPPSNDLSIDSCLQALARLVPTHSSATTLRWEGPKGKARQGGTGNEQTRSRLRKPESCAKVRQAGRKEVHQERHGSRGQKAGCNG